VGEARGALAEPGLVELDEGVRLAGEDAVDEGAVGGAGVPVEAALQGPRALVDELLLLVVDAEQVVELFGGPAFDADVDVLAGGRWGLRARVADGADDRLQELDVLPLEDRGHFCSPSVHALPILAGGIDLKRDLLPHESTAHSQKHFRKI